MYQLAKVESAEQWTVLHAIRREVLFDTGIMPFVYDEHRPEDRRAGNTPYLLMLNGEPIGVARLDISGPTCIVRLVGITMLRQREGHGRSLSNLIDAQAASQGVSELRVIAYKDAVGFYEGMGWSRHVWDAAELAHLAPGNIQMTKIVKGG